MLTVWGFALAALARSRGVGTPAALLIVLLVMSHWLLDYVTHAPDMPLWPGTGSPRIGLGLWNSVPGTIAVEGTMWIAGIAIYLRGCRPTGPVGAVAFWSFVLVTTLMWVSGPWSPPPPSVTALEWLGLTGWVVVPWAVWADRHCRRVAPAAG